MANYVKFLLAALAVMSVTASCGKKNLQTDTTSEYKGYWECSTLVLDGNDCGEYYPNTEFPVYTFYNITLGDDGKGVLSSPMGEYINKLSGSDEESSKLFTWESDKSGVTISGDNENDVIKLDYQDGRLIMNQGDASHSVEVWFSKVEHFSVFDFPSY